MSSILCLCAAVPSTRLWSMEEGPASVPDDGSLGPGPPPRKDPNPRAYMSSAGCCWFVWGKKFIISGSSESGQYSSLRIGRLVNVV